MSSDLRSLVDLLKALAHPMRLRILALLRPGEMCVCQVTEVLGLAPSTVSEHLTALRRAEVLVERKEGKWVHYALSTDPALLPLLEALWPRLDELDETVDDARRARDVRAVPVPDTCARMGRTT